jgi:hypothetical protein
MIFSYACGSDLGPYSFFRFWVLQQVYYVIRNALLRMHVTNKDICYRGLQQYGIIISNILRYVYGLKVVITGSKLISSSGCFEAMCVNCGFMHVKVKFKVVECENCDMYCNSSKQHNKAQ